MVLLSTQNLRLQGSRKLLPRFIGPFAIKALVGKHAYRLDLPPHMHIHDVMHVSLLKPFKPSERSQPLPAALMVDADEEFEVETILLHRPAGRSQLEFLVRWRGYDATTLGSHRIISPMPVMLSRSIGRPMQRYLLAALSLLHSSSRT